MFYIYVRYDDNIRVLFKEDLGKESVYYTIKNIEKVLRMLKYKNVEVKLIV